MNASLFLLCPTDCLEFIINKEFEGKNYFYSSLGNTSTFDSITLEAIKGLIDKHHIREIYFVLSMRNKIVSDAMGGQTFPQTRMLQNFTKEIGLHKKQSKLFYHHSTSMGLDNNRCTIVCCSNSTNIVVLSFKK